MKSIERCFSDIGRRGSLQIVATIVVVLGCGSALFHSTESRGQDAGPKTTYHFRLTKGNGTSVCEAFERNLNSASYSRPPYCGIPRGDSIRGFGKLKEVPLTSEEVSQLWPHLFWFNFNQNQFLKNEDFTKQYPSPIALKIYGTEVFAWKYDPPVSMNNDGRLDNVLMWQGYGAELGPTNGSCGEIVPTGSTNAEYEAVQRGYVLTPDNREMDIAETREIFGDPNGAVAPARYESRGYQTVCLQVPRKILPCSVLPSWRSSKPKLASRAFAPEGRYARGLRVPCDS